MPTKKGDTTVDTQFCSKYIAKTWFKKDLIWLKGPKYVYIPNKTIFLEGVLDSGQDMVGVA